MTPNSTVIGDCDSHKRYSLFIKDTIGIEGLFLAFLFIYKSSL